MAFSSMRGLSVMMTPGLALFARCPSAPSLPFRGPMSVSSATQIGRGIVTPSPKRPQGSEGGSGRGDAGGGSVRRSRVEPDPQGRLRKQGPRTYPRAPPYADSHQPNVLPITNTPVWCGPRRYSLADSTSRRERLTARGRGLSIQSRKAPPAEPTGRNGQQKPRRQKGKAIKPRGGEASSTGLFRKPNSKGLVLMKASSGMTERDFSLRMTPRIQI